MVSASPCAKNCPLAFCISKIGASYYLQPIHISPISYVPLDEVSSSRKIASSDDICKPGSLAPRADNNAIKETIQRRPWINIGKHFFYT